MKKYSEDYKPICKYDSNEEYRSYPHLSSSHIKDFIESPLFFYHTYFNPKKQTESMRKGTNIHTAILEPEKLSRFIVEPDFGDMRSTKNREDKLAWHHSLSQDSTLVSQEELEALLKIQKNVQINPWSFFLDDTKKELSLYAKCRATHLGIKARPDAFSDDVLIDVKSTDRIKPNMDWVIRDYHYDIQLAFYDYVLDVCGFKMNRYLILWVENKAPYDVVFMEIPREIIDSSKIYLKKLLEDFKICFDNNKWPGKQGQELSMAFRKL